MVQLSFWHRRSTQITIRVLLVGAIIGITFHAVVPLRQMVINTGWDVSNHILAFFVLAFGLDFAFPNRRLGIWSITVLLAYGVAIEFVQSFIPNRFPSVPDILADVAGVAIYLALVPVLRRVPLFAGRWRSSADLSSNQGASAAAETGDPEKVRKN